MDDLDSLLLRLDLPLARRYVSGLFSLFDKNRTGWVEFEEVESYILYESFGV